jgi:predicted PurR-regulated permease PerM
MPTQGRVPLYQKFSFNLVSLSLLCVLLYVGKSIILPILFSILLATMLLPSVRFLTAKRWPAVLAIILPIFITLVMGAAVLYFMSSQVMNFVGDLPGLQERVNTIAHTFQLWFKENTSITIWRQDQYINDTITDLKDGSWGYVGSTINSLTSILSYVALMPICTFLILYYRSNIAAFFVSMFQAHSRTDVAGILSESSTISQKYLIGLLLETTLVFSLNTVGFLLIGIKYALFLALVAALLNLIPYVGILVANILCMFITMISSSELRDVLWVGITLAIVQVWDNNFGMTLIVGNRVRINGLATILGVLAGGALCGIPGMFLAIPGLAVLKVIFDRVPNLHPWGQLMGDKINAPILKKKLAVENNDDAK